MKNVLIIAIAMLAACSPAVKAPVIDEAVTKEVLDRHFKTFQQNDIDGLMADYAPDAILVTPNGIYKGTTEIRDNFIRVFKVIPTDGTTITFSKNVVTRDIAYVVWTATTPTLNFKYASDTFIIVDGKIISQTFAGDVAPVAASATSTE